MSRDLFFEFKKLSTGHEKGDVRSSRDPGTVVREVTPSLFLLTPFKSLFIKTEEKKYGVSHRRRRRENDPERVYDQK